MLDMKREVKRGYSRNIYENEDKWKKIYFGF